MSDQKYDFYLEYFNGELGKVFDSLSADAPDVIKDAMRYATEGGGKRIRPVLLLAAAEMLGVKKEKALPFSISLELIHSYSLVHDDLPAMDNDDFRRGKPSTHKKFGEAYGILCGDALLNFAFEYALSFVENKDDIAALKILADLSGYNGTIKGQVLDLYYQGVSADEKVLYEIYLNKTANLLIAPFLMASALSGGKYADELKELGKNLGLLFQFTDDILDMEGTLSEIGKTPLKDEIEDKLTSVKIFGIVGAKHKCLMYYNNCLNILSKIKGSEFIQSLVESVYRRKK